ncbi:MAG: CHAT domain-containing protein [Myxococcales bacterium]|nr:CHAT domain-containing protein [Myxococcales bacterium]
MKPVPEALFLVLEFARAEQGGDPYAFRLERMQYLLRSADGNFETAELDWDQALLADLGALQKPERDPVLLQRLGETLRRFLQPAGWAEQEARIQQAISEHQRVVLTVRSAAAELYALPWELITLKGSGQHLAELPEVLIRYEWPGTSTTPALEAPASATGRILVCWSAAAGAVPATEHIAAIHQATEQHRSSFDQDRDVLPHASLGKLDAILESAQRSGPPISVLHILCHGSAAGQTFGLALQGEDAEERIVVDAGRLRQLLAPYAQMVRLVVLAACDSGNSGALGNQLGSVAQALHRAGLAHVVASRYPLSVAGSIRLTQVLYRELLSDGGSLEQAVLSARHSLARDAVQIDWASLQLYGRASDPGFQPPSYLRGPHPKPLGPSTEGAETASPSQAAVSLTVSRRKLFAAAGVLGTLLLASILLFALWPESPEEGPIVLENGRCLTLEQSDFETQRDGGDVIQWVCHGGANQNWHRADRRIVSSNGLCLEVSPPDFRSGRNGGRIQVGACNQAMDNQQWQHNQRELRTYNNKCLAISSQDFASGKQGGAVQQWDCTGKPNQWFSDGHRSR